MQEILHNFGVNWAAFFAQLITFGVVFYILKTYAFQPIINVLEERRQRISEARPTPRRSRNSSPNPKQGIARFWIRLTHRPRSLSARRARAVILSPHAASRKRSPKRNASSPRAHEATVLEHDRVLSEVKRELGRLVIDTTAKVTGKILTPEDQQRLSEETSRQVA